MKAVLVIDMPMDCQFCKMAHWSKTDVLMGCDAVAGKKYGDVEFWNDGRPSWCPLRPLPTRNEYEPKDDHPYTKAEIIAYTYGLAVGRNQVIEEITGETE